MKKVFLIFFLCLTNSLFSFEKAPCELSNLAQDFPPGFTSENDLLSWSSKLLLHVLKAYPMPTNMSELDAVKKRPLPAFQNNPDVIVSNEKIEEIPIRIFTPKKEGEFPVFVFFHGGGWVLGSIEMYSSFCQQICLKANCVVVSVDYRLAPEYPFPKPLEDCYKATSWVSENLKKLKGRSLIIGGDSAGGNLAAAVTLLAKEKNTPKIDSQILICPVLHYGFDTLSYFMFSEGYFLTKESMKFFWKSYLKEESQGKDPLASPLKASCLAGLPPAALVIANFDPLRDEGLSYGLRLFREGVQTSIKRFNSFHAFYFMDYLPESKEAVAFIAEQIK